MAGAAGWGVLGRSAGVGLLLLAAGLPGNAKAEEPGVSRALAQSRAARISALHYALHFTLTPHAATTDATETLRFRDSGAGDLALDYRDGIISTATLNGKALATTLGNGHLMLPASALLRGDNTLEVKFASALAPAGKAITRYADRDDGSEYIYTLFVPMDASMAFPCFDQPDLKAKFSLSVEHPAGWTVIGNTAAQPQGSTATSFAESEPISTYLFAFAAGPFQKLPGAAAGEPALFVRKSQLARAKTEAPQVQQITARGIAYLSAYFARPFPFSKYDLVLIPGFPFGGMEHAGATFLNEDGVLFRSAPTEADRFRRNTLLLHETTHQWFGDLVTMRWFDDLWLKEGFAQYMAYHALAELEPAQQPWKHFYEDIKPLAYGIDETEGTTPIFQNILNLKDAKSAYGAIVYQKAPAVLKQLEFFLGEENFRAGLRLYLKEHAYANAQWADLIGAFERTGNKDVQAWAKAWILQRGMPEVTVNFGCSGSKITKLWLQQRDVLGHGSLWPMSNKVLLMATQFTNTPQQGVVYHVDVQSVKVSWHTATYDVAEAAGRPCPNIVFANEGDFGYGRFLMDDASASLAASLLVPGEHVAPGQQYVALLSNQTDPLRRSMFYGALWDNVHTAHSAPSSFVELVLHALPAESDESLSRILGAHAATALHAYMTDRGRAKYAPQMEEIALDRMLNAPTLGLRIVNFRTFTGIAETPAALHQLKDLLAGNLAIPGLTLRPLDRWNLVGHLIAHNDPEAGDAFAHERSTDKSGEGQKYAYAAEAGTPTATVKARYFEEYLHSLDRQEDWITQSLGNFNAWNQAHLTAPYLTRALDQLPEVKLHRKIFFLGAWINSFIGGQKSPEAQAAVHAWLASARIDPDLRLKVLEAAHALDRTVLIRQRFPE